MNKSLIIVVLLCGAIALVSTYQAHRTASVVTPVPQPPPVVVTPPVPTPIPPIKKESTYDGTWVTSGPRGRRHLNGTMTAIVTNLTDTTWQGKFFGVWQGSSYSYTVGFSGLMNSLSGTAVVDNVNYTWTGQIVNGIFTGTFVSHRHSGNFTLKEK